MASGSDEEDMASNMLLETLIQAWINEKSAPVLLEYEGNAVDNLTERLSEQERDAREQARASDQHLFMSSIYEMEIARIKYVIRDYLRTRLWKIEKAVTQILKSDDLKARLSVHELKYADGYKALLEQHMQNAVLNRIPEKFRKTDTPRKEEQIVSETDPAAHVFCKVNETAGLVAIDDENNVQLSKGDIYIVRYEPIAALVGDKVSLL